MTFHSLLNNKAERLLRSLLYYEEPQMFDPESKKESDTEKEPEVE